MRALSKENTTCNSKIHLHKSTVCVLRSTIYTPRTDKHIRREDSGGGGGWGVNEGKKRKRGRCFTLDGSLSVPVTESGIKCCLDWRVDKNSLLSEKPLFINWRRNVEDEWAEEKEGAGEGGWMRWGKRVGQMKERKQERHRKGGVGKTMEWKKIWEGRWWRCLFHPP